MSMSREDAPKRSKDETVQVRIFPATRRRVLLLAALLEIPPKEVVALGVDLYAEKRRRDKDVISTMGSLGFQPIEQDPTDTAP
jgi:hypothetical protein